MADIFISYKREDQEEHGRVKPIADALRAEGYDVFYDVHVPPGSKWEDVLEGKIAMARAVLVLWSSSSVESDWVKEEAEMAKAAGKLIPVMLDQVSPPFGFARIESANLAEWDGALTNIEWKNLVAAVKSRIGTGERSAQPGVTAVAYPRKQVTVTKTSGTGSGGGSRGVLVGLVVIAVAALGFAGFTLFGDRSDGGSTTATGEPAIVAAEADPPAATEAPATRDDTPSATPVPPPQVLPAGDTYEIGGFTVGRLSYSPAPGATIAPTDRVTVNYRYSAAPNGSGYRFWTIPTVRGERCSAANGGSQVIDGRGTGQTYFTVVGDACDTAAITGLTLVVKDEATGRETREEIPIAYRVASTGGTRAAAPFPGTEDCLRYTSGFTVREQSGAWQLRSGSALVQTVASREEAMTLLRLITEYGLTEQCFVGRPDPGLSYWKTREGALPSLPGIADPDCLNVQGSNLSVRVRGGMSLVMDGARSMMRFREREKAETAVAILQHYGASEICYVGRPGPSMTYLKR
ncbi:MAG: toll/interleukin-1 receptor domain-containing protein [Pseudomonadota bacterium]